MERPNRNVAVYDSKYSSTLNLKKALNLTLSLTIALR